MSAGRRCKIARIVRSRILARSRLRRVTLTATSLLLMAPVFVSPVLKAQSEATAEDARVQKFYGQAKAAEARGDLRSEEHTSELQSHSDLVCRLLLEKKKKKKYKIKYIKKT